jgi:DedD protein
MAEEQQDVETLKRRGRRRLVGAVALVLAAVIVLPMVFDPEPKSTLPPVSVKIPGENETPFKPKPPPATRAPKAEPVKPAAPAQAQEYVVVVGTYAKPETVVGKLSGAKIPYYTEPVSGNLVRVRAGPFPSREAAEQALGKLRALGLKPGTVATK